MSKIDKEQINHLARLARIEVDETESGKISQRLSEVLEYVEMLGKASTKETKPILQIAGLENIARQDSVTNGDERENLLKNAPAKKDGFIRVKKIFE